MLSKSICEKTLNEMYDISYNNPPLLTPREFTISVLSISNVIGSIPYGLAIGLSVVVKHFLKEKNIADMDISSQVQLFSNEIRSYFSSYSSHPEDALEGLVSYVHMTATGRIVMGYEINLAIQNCVESGEHYEWYQNEAIRVKLLSVY